MARKQIIEDKGDYLLVTDSRAMNSKNIEKFLDDLINTCKQSNLIKIIVDLSNAPIKLDLLDHHKGGEQFASLFIGYKVAFVFKEIKNNYSFGETVALNRGANLCLFTSKNDAVEWLNREDSYN